MFFPIVLHIFPSTSRHFSPSPAFIVPQNEAHRGRGEAPRPRAVLGPGHPGGESAQAAADHGGAGGTVGRSLDFDPGDTVDIH